MLADPDRAGRIEGCLVALVRSHREGETCPTPEQWTGPLPVVPRALSDYLLWGQATALEAAGRRAALTGAAEGTPPAFSERRP